MKIEAFNRIVAPLFFEAMSHGLIVREMRWSSPRYGSKRRFEMNLDGDIPAVVDVAAWDREACQINWTLWPTSADVPLDTAIGSNSWSGEAWGSASVDARIGMRLNEYGKFHCRISRRNRLKQVSDVTPTIKEILHARYMNTDQVLLLR